MKYLALFVILSVGCGEDRKPNKCNKNDRHGTYRVTTTHNSGSCGALGTFYVQLDHGDELNDCLISREEWSKDECTLSRSLTCTVMVHDTGSGATTVYTLNWTQTSTQQDNKGDIFSGPVSLASSGNDGSSCSGSYHFSYTRVSE